MKGKSNMKETETENGNRNKNEIASVKSSGLINLLTKMFPLTQLNDF